MGNLTLNGSTSGQITLQPTAVAGTNTITLPASTGTLITDQSASFQPGVVISGSSSGDALRITQTGAGNALVVEDSTNPDSTPFVIDASGRIIEGYTSALSNYSAGGANRTPQVQIQGPSTSFATQSITNWASGTTATGASYLILSKSPSNTVGSQSALSATDQYIGVLQFNGDDGTNFIPSAWIRSATDGTPGTNDMPGRLEFATTADGASSPTERMRIDSSGNLLVGTTTQATGALLTVNGSIKGTITSGTAQASTSGTAINFTGIPSWVTRITVLLAGVSGNGTADLTIQLGYGATPTYATSAYQGSCSTQAGTAVNNSTSFIIVNSNAAASVWSGSITFYNSTGNTWVESGMLGNSGAAGARYSGGHISLGTGNTLTAIRITSTDTFDAGSINILYEG